MSDFQDDFLENAWQRPEISVSEYGEIPDVRVFRLANSAVSKRIDLLHASSQAVDVKRQADLHQNLGIEGVRNYGNRKYYVFPDDKPIGKLFVKMENVTVENDRPVFTLEEEHPSYKMVVKILADIDKEWQEGKKALAEEMKMVAGFDENQVKHLCVEFEELNGQWYLTIKNPVYSSYLEDKLTQKFVLSPSRLELLQEEYQNFMATLAPHYEEIGLWEYGAAIELDDREQEKRRVIEGYLRATKRNVPALIPSNS